MDDGLADVSAAVDWATDAASDTPGTRGTDGVTPQRPRTTRTHLRTIRHRLIPFVSGVFVVLVALALYQRLSPATQPLTAADIDQRVASVLASQEPLPAYSEAVFDIIAPSMVLISTHGGPATTPDIDAATSPGPATGWSGSLGSGVVVTPDGQVFTALHVVEDATDITLTFIDGSTSSATVLQADPSKDIAVLQAATLPSVATPAVLGNPNVPIGSDAYVVGNPYGLFGSMSAGVISGRGRTFQEHDGGPRIRDLIQFDAAVNPGNSGGPLARPRGSCAGHRHRAAQPDPGGRVHRHRPGRAHRLPPVPPVACPRTDTRRE